MIALVAGGGFVPQSVTDSSELTDSTMVRNVTKGEKGELFIQFSFSSSPFVIRRVSRHFHVCPRHSSHATGSLEQKQISSFQSRM